MAIVILITMIATLVVNAGAVNIFCTGADQHVFSVQHNVQFSANGGPVKIPFNIVTRNDNNVYNDQTAEFTAPERGVYLFHFSAAAHSNLMGISLVKGSTRLVTAFAGAKDSSASNMLQVELNANDKISVQLHPGHTIRACNSACATFDGRLLYKTA